MGTLHQLRTRHVVRLQHLDRRPWTQETFTDVADAWAWVATQVADQLETDPERVDAFDAPEGTMATVDGIPVCWIVHGLPAPLQ